MIPADGTIQKNKFMFKKFVNYENMFQEFLGKKKSRVKTSGSRR